MRDSPLDTLDQATDALEGIGDLLVSVNGGNLHLVNPENLLSLVSLVVSQLRAVHAGFAEQLR